jgi:hypothetical protein
MAVSLKLKRREMEGRIFLLFSGDEAAEGVFARPGLAVTTTDAMVIGETRG